MGRRIVQWKAEMSNKEQRVPHRHPLEFPPLPPPSSSQAAAPDWQAGGKPRQLPAPSRSSLRRG